MKNVETSAQRDQAMDQRLWERFHSAQGKAARKRNVRIGFCITLLVLVLASVINWGVVTGWGNVRIDRLNIVGEDGAQYSALLYVPKSATSATPAPGIVMYHGNAGNARNHESWAVEYSRRGFVVLSIDQFGAGNSQGYFDGSVTGATQVPALCYEADTWFQYMQSLPIVDQENIITSGHSMGTTSAAAIGAKYGVKLIEGASPVILLGGEDEYAQAWNSYTGNYVALMGLVETTEEKAKEAGLAELQKRDPAATDFELGTLYGSFADNDAYIYILEPDRIHEAAFVSQQTIGNLLYYAQECLGDAVPNYIDSTDQVWMYKDYTGLFGIYAFAAFVCALALLLIEEVPAFAAVKRPIPRNIGLRGPGLAISIALGLFFPYLVLKTDAFGIIGGRFFENLRSWGFDLGYSNMAFGVVVGLNICGLAGFLLYYFTDGKKHKLNLTDLGLTPESYEETADGGAKARAVAGQILRTLLLSAVVVAIAWSYLKLQNEVFGTDFYAWFFGVKDIPIVKIPHYINYLVIWILCFVIASFGMNIERRLPTTGKETLDIVLAIAFNVAIATFVITLVVAVKWHLQTIGSPADTNLIWKMGVDTQRIWGMPVGMGVGVGGSTFLYKKTGNTWLSAILMGTVACLMCLLFGGTRFHFLTFYC